MESKISRAICKLASCRVRTKNRCNFCDYSVARETFIGDAGRGAESRAGGSCQIILAHSSAQQLTYSRLSLVLTSHIFFR